ASVRRAGPGPRPGADPKGMPPRQWGAAIGGTFPLPVREGPAATGPPARASGWQARARMQAQMQPCAVRATVRRVHAPLRLRDGAGALERTPARGQARAAAKEMRSGDSDFAPQAPPATVARLAIGARDTLPRDGGARASTPEAAAEVVRNCIPQNCGGIGGRSSSGASLASQRAWYFGPWASVRARRSFES